MDHDDTSPDDHTNLPHLENEQDRSIAHDRPRRNVKAPTRFGDYVTYALQVEEEVESLEPTTYREAITSKDTDMWIAAMGEEIESLHKNKIWELVQLPERRKVVGCKWVFKMKIGLPGSDIVRFKARLVTKGYSQKEGIDYNEIFFPMVRHTSIRVLLSFKGIVLAPSLHLSHMFYADDAIFMGQWSEPNIDVIVHVLDCFHRASGLRINMAKSKLLGISVVGSKVDQAAAKIGCMTLKTPFTYLGACVGGLMSRLQSWNEIVERMIRLQKKLIWVKWKNALASKDKGGLGVSSLFALNRALLFKWVWQFFSHSSSLWVRVVKALHGEDGKIVELLKSRGIDLISFIHYKLGNGENTSFWNVAWRGETAFKFLYLRMYALESSKSTDVASKLSHSGLEFSFRRNPRSGMEQVQFDFLKEKAEGCVLVNMKDRGFWSLEGSGVFSVASAKKLIDGVLLQEVSSKTRWIKEVPIKINVHRWKVKLDCLPTRFNLSRRGIDIDSILCPLCGKAAESSRYMEITSYEEWLNWIMSLRLSLKHKRIFE
ncbi:RNA-directed DNA polymerase, eukaryota, reverse transcriptase zinc-binding domain protein, partial [Tanacetum coccineum]